MEAGIQTKAIEEFNDEEQELHYNDESKEEEDAKCRLWISVAVASFFVLTILGLTLYYHPKGDFGDMFGAANATFTGFAFVALIATLWTQQLELKLQRQELRDTRLEFEQQRFQSTFFQLVDSYIRLRAQFLANRETDPVTICYGNLLGQVANNGRNKRTTDEVHKAARIYLRGNSEISQLAKLAVKIIQVVDEDADDKKAFYVSIFKCHLSNDEFIIFAWFCSCGLVSQKDVSRLNANAFFNNIFWENDALAQIKSDFPSNE